jgi:hypothetical protein
MHSIRAVPGLAALVGVVSGGPMAVAADAPAPPEAPPPTQRVCSTRLLTATQLEAGEQSTITCTEVDAATVASYGRGPTQAGDKLLAVHWDDLGGAGADLYVWGNDCNGGGVSFGSGHAWDNRISSTEHGICSKIKHFRDAPNTIPSWVTDGPGVRDLMGSTNNQTSAIRYFGPTNP